MTRVFTKCPRCNNSTSLKRTEGSHGYTNIRCLDCGCYYERILGREPNLNDVFYHNGIEFIICSIKGNVIEGTNVDPWTKIPAMVRVEKEEILLK